MELIDWKGLKALGFPYSRAHTQRLEDLGLFPKRVRLRECQNVKGINCGRVAWVKQQYLDWAKTRLS